MSLDVYLEGEDGMAAWEANVTHNLNKMADAAGIYEILWRPEEVAIVRALDLIEKLEAGIAAMKADPAKFKAFNPKNGWGDYDGFVRWCEEYLAACRNFPWAKVRASR